MINKATCFTNFLENVARDPSIKDTLVQAEHKYNIRAYNISTITPQQALKLYESINTKFYKNNSHQKSASWFQNQLRLFVWIAVCYSHLQQICIQNLVVQSEHDWQYFSQIFQYKDPKLFQYQCHCLYLDNKGKHWQSLEENLLKQIMSNSKINGNINGRGGNSNKVKWNEVSKQLFQLSNKQYLRTPKQCRQRWNNHLDPSKVKGMWQRQQCLKMFQYVREHGKKWAVLVKILGNVRNQHSIKNKFNSMVRRHVKSVEQQKNNKNSNGNNGNNSNSKKQKREITQQQLYDEIINKIISAINNQKNRNTNDDFDFQDDDDMMKNRKKYTESTRLTSTFTQNFMQKLRRFGDNTNPSNLNTNNNRSKQQPKYDNNNNNNNNKKLQSQSPLSSISPSLSPSLSLSKQQKLMKKQQQQSSMRQQYEQQQQQQEQQYQNEGSQIDSEQNNNNQDDEYDQDDDNNNDDKVSSQKVSQILVDNRYPKTFVRQQHRQKSQQILNTKNILLPTSKTIDNNNNNNININSDSINNKITPVIDIPSINYIHEWPVQGQVQVQNQNNNQNSSINNNNNTLNNKNIEQYQNLSLGQQLND